MSFLRNPTWQAKVNDKSKEACKHASRPNRLVHPTPDSTSNRHSSKAFLEPLQKQDNRLLHPHGEAVARTLTFVHQHAHTACFSKQVINIERDVHVLACIRFLCICIRTDVSTRRYETSCTSVYSSRDPRHSYNLPFDIAFGSNAIIHHRGIYLPRNYGSLARNQRIIW